MAERPRLGVVVGASGGLGRALLARMEADSRFEAVAALSRRPPRDWDTKGPGSARRLWLSVDLTREDSLAQAAQALGERGEVVRAVVAAGLLHAPDLAPERTYRSLSPDAFARLFAINAAGPALAAKHLLPLTPRERPSLFAALSARVGSLADNRLGGWYAYRASKAALNMIVRTLAIEHARTRPHGVCVALHPGTVHTPLSAPFQKGVAAERLFSPDAAAEALERVMDGLTPSDTGRVFAWDGQPIPW
ncbi:MAG: SDR family NAD(P)-dependent oxidoreductase [Alphaproteobacteria bacterium]|nr:SDR family NAD(P)-dependent oxidoreductase [Alphaproteobacteria bacterium]